MMAPSLRWMGKVLCFWLSLHPLHTGTSFFIKVTTCRQLTIVYFYSMGSVSYVLYLQFYLCIFYSHMNPCECVTDCTTIGIKRESVAFWVCLSVCLFVSTDWHCWWHIPSQMEQWDKHTGLPRRNDWWEKLLACWKRILTQVNPLDYSKTMYWQNYSFNVNVFWHTSSSIHFCHMTEMWTLI